MLLFEEQRARREQTSYPQRVTNLSDSLAIRTREASSRGDQT